jgi:hypothetical protein
VVIQPDGSWSFPANAPLFEGGNVITAQAVDGKGQASSISGGLECHCRYHLTIPRTEKMCWMMLQKIPLTSGQVTNDSTPTFSGTGEAGATLNVMEGERHWYGKYRREWRLDMDAASGLSIPTQPDVCRRGCSR